jgi:hypothetical protein
MENAEKKNSSCSLEPQRKISLYLGAASMTIYIANSNASVETFLILR